MKNFTITKLGRAALIAAVAAAALCLVGCGGDGGTNSDDGGSGNRGGDIVGDWLVHSGKLTIDGEDHEILMDADYVNTRTVESYRSSGSAFVTRFEKSDGIWREIGSSVDSGYTWSKDGSTICVDGMGHRCYQYNVSNGILTMDVYGYVMTYIKTDLDGFRRSLGL